MRHAERAHDEDAMAQTSMPDVAAIRARQQQTWATGDFAVLGSLLTIVSEHLCEAVDLRAGWTVLDVATGSGNTALAAARRFCEVTGIDFVPALLERGRERAAAERLPIAFLEGDAEALPFPDASFDAVLSTFGVMFAPDQERAAAELLRVCRPGGKIGLASWTPDSIASENSRTVGRHVPPPPGLRPPTRWGTEEGVRELFGDHISALQVQRRTLVQRFRSPEHWLELFRTYFGPVAQAFEAVEREGEPALARDLLALIERSNRSGDATLVLHNDYLEVVATRR
jgi:ubiquinone/menaquinone biosynthesis C-methylase UbiE